MSSCNYDCVRDDDEYMRDGDECMRDGDECMRDGDESNYNYNYHITITDPSLQISLPVDTASLLPVHSSLLHYHVDIEIPILFEHSHYLHTDTL